MARNQEAQRSQTQDRQQTDEVRDERSTGPESLRVIDRGVELDHVSAGNDFIQHGQRWWSFGVAHALAFLLLGQRLFDLDFTQTLDERLHAGAAQSLDQLVGRRFMSIC